MKKRYTDEELIEHRRAYQKYYYKNGPKNTADPNAEITGRQEYYAKYYQEVGKIKQQAKRKEEQDRHRQMKFHKMNPFYAYIHTYLHEHSIKFSDLAKKIGVGSSTLCRWLKCDREIPVTKFYSISVAVETDMVKLYEIYKSSIDSVKNGGETDER